MPVRSIIFRSVALYLALHRSVPVKVWDLKLRKWLQSRFIQGIFSQFVEIKNRGFLLIFIDCYEIFSVVLMLWKKNHKNCQNQEGIIFDINTTGENFHKKVEENPYFPFPQNVKKYP